MHIVYTHICSCFFNRAYIWNPSMEHPFGHRKEVHICRETSAESCCWSFGNTRPPYQHCGSLYFHEWTCPKSKPYMTGSPSKWWFGSQDWFQHFKKKISAKIHDHPWLSDATGTFPSWMDSGVALTWPGSRSPAWKAQKVGLQSNSKVRSTPWLHYAHYLGQKNISFPPEVRQHPQKK